MTRFSVSETHESQGHLAGLADAAVRASGELGARIAEPLRRGEDPGASLGDTAGAVGAPLSREMIDLALANAGSASIDARANKLAFQLLTTVPSSPVAQLLAAVAARASRRAGPALGPFVDADDLLSLLRWKLWTLPAEYFASTRILKHPGLAAYLSVIARRIVIDECRAMDNRGRAGIEPETIEVSTDPRATLDAVLDDVDLLQRFASELPEWQAPIVDVLAGQAERDDALRAINHQREAAELPAWSADSMRTAVHRARKRLRDLLVRTPSRLSSEEPVAAAEAPPVHGWRRFWCSRDASYSLADDGFLVDPETEYGRHTHDVVALDRVADVPCLALLGEPGIGKSTAIRQERERLASDGQPATLVDLSRATGSDSLRHAVERAAATNVSPVYVLFDALDEGLAHNQALTSDLIAIVGSVDPSRVRIRIACRTLEWPPELEGALRQRFDADAFRVLELLPLRRIDVIAAANDHSVDGIEFVRELREREATALAIRPISLRFLIAMFAADGALPHSKAPLFDEGTLILCSEEGALQRGRRRRNPDVVRRRAIAARLAVASTFTNRHTIVRDERHDKGALPASIAIGRDELPDAKYSIDAGAVEDVLVGTALFTARTATTFGWSHQSYREFLAAWFLAQHGIGAEATESLYFRRSGSRVPAPLREVAAWHATFVPALFDQIVERDPEVLLHSDGAVSTESRAQLVRALLDRMARFEALDSRLHRRDYQKLAHPQLGDQLRHYIADRNANIVVRRKAMNIAWTCGAHDVIDELVAVLLDREDEVQARGVAARALAELGGHRVRDTFIALLAAGFAPDLNDAIRGSVLGFLWPDHIDAPTLFRHLAIPQRDNYLGAYQRVLESFPATLHRDHLVLALEWVESVDGHADYHIQHAQRSIIDIALRFVEQEEVRRALVRIIQTSLGTRTGAWHAEASARRRSERTLSRRDRLLITRDLIRGAADDDQLAYNLLFFDPPLIGPDDIGWIAELATTADEQVQRACGECIAAIYRQYDYPTDTVAADAVVSVEAPAFQEPLRPFLAPVELTSDRARELSERWGRIHGPQASKLGDEAPEPTRWSIAGPILAHFEAGELAAWIDLVARWSDGSPKPIASDDAWAGLEPPDRERMILAALRYVQGFDAPDLAWLDVPNDFPRSAIAARSALQLIAATRPAFLDAIAETTWQRWCPVLVAVPFPSMTNAERAELFRRCAKFEQLPATIVRIARRDNLRGSHVSVLSELPDPVPAPLHAPLLLVAPELGDDAFEDALELLLGAGSDAARDLARRALRDAAPPRAARVARVLLPHDSTQWPIVIARMQSEREFTDTFGALVAYREDTGEKPFSTLTSQHAAELYLVLLRQHPPAEDLRGPRGRLTPSDKIEWLRDSVMAMLVEAGSDSAIRALEWLRDQEPECEALRYCLMVARQRVADTAWGPLSIDELRSLLSTGADETLPAVDAPDVVPSVAPSAPLRRDASREEIIALLEKVNVLVETATPAETAAVHAAMQPLPGQNTLIVGSAGIATYTIGMLGNYGVAHFQSDMGSEGPNAAQLAANDAIVEARPRLLLLVGIAFGLKRARQRLGDVLVGQHITSYEMVKLRPDAVDERGETLRADATLIERIQAHGRTWSLPRADGSPVSVHVGQVLSGAKLVNNHEFRDELVHRFPNALGGEMEGVGAYAAAFRHRVPVLLVKAICDWADGAKDDHAQPFAAKAAIDLVRHLLDKPDVLAALGIAMWSDR